MTIEYLAIFVLYFVVLIYFLSHQRQCAHTGSVYKYLGR